MKNLKCKVVGHNEIRINNPQSADPLNKYAKEMKGFTAIRKKTDSDIEAMRNLEVESKLYFNEEIGVWIPSTWIMASIAGESFKQCKISKKNTRGAVFLNDFKVKLTYNGMKKVKTISDLVLNPDFRTTELLKQGMVKIAKSTPTFDGWSFEINFDFDEEVFTDSEIKKILKVAVERNGFGDFRPTYGRGSIEDLVISELDE